MDLHILFQPSNRPEVGAWPQDSQDGLGYAALTNDTHNITSLKKKKHKEEKKKNMHIPIP